jgi:DNA-directed RNA polymerase specialized sigma24 family protein
VSLDTEIFGKHYKELKDFAFKKTGQYNRVDIHQDLLHDVIHSYLSHKDKKKIKDPVAWIKCKMNYELCMPNATFHRTWISPSRIEDELQTYSLRAVNGIDDKALMQLIAEHLLNDFHYVERTFMIMRISGYSTPEIAKLLEIPYDTVYRIIKETMDLLADKVKDY